MIHDDKITISVADKTNPLWGKLMLMWEQRLDELRQTNDRQQTDESTAFLRGRIAEIKSMLGKNDDTPIIE